MLFFGIFKLRTIYERGAHLYAMTDYVKNPIYVE